MARIMRRIGPAMHAIAGALLAASGVYLILYWLPQVLGDSDPGASLGTVNEVSSAVANFLTGHTGAFAIALGLIVVAALAFALRPPAHPARRD